MSGRPRLDAPALDHLNAERAAGRPLGVAVSGGSDSTALLLLLSDIFGADALRAVTVDHGLRSEAADEARAVSRLCAARDIPHDTLRWEGWTGQGNLQDQARRARYGLLTDWAAGQGVAAVALGHTQDDNAETFVMGLARGAGLDGLTGMRPGFRRDGVTFLRPLLGTRREALREYLRGQDVGWCDDPSNEDPAYDRVRVRRALATLEELGIGAAHLSRSIANLRDTRAALARTLADWARVHVAQDRGDLLIDAGGLGGLPPDMARRLLNAALRWVSGADYPPRAESVMQIVTSPSVDRTLHGCLLRGDGARLRISREPEAAKRAGSVATTALWDGRWRLDGPHAPELDVSALTEADLPLCPDWRDTGLPRASLAASPAVRRGGELVAAPLAGLRDGWSAELANGRDDFAAAGFSH